MIKGAKIKCNKEEMQSILNSLIMSNNYQLPKDLVFIIKENKPIFGFHFYNKKKLSIAENENVVSTINSIDGEEIIDNQHQPKETKDTSPTIDHISLNKQNIADSINAELLNKINVAKIKFEQLKSTNKELEETITKQDELIEIMFSEIKLLRENRNEFINLLRDKIELIGGHKIFNEEEQNLLIKLCYDEEDSEELPKPDDYKE